MNLLKELSLFSHSFHQICSKHLFATVDLHYTSSKKRFVELVESRPNVVNYIRKLTYKVRSYNNDEDRRLSAILSKFLLTISRLNCLAITGNAFHNDWDALDSSLTSAFLHLMRFPTINHIDLSNIKNFPFSSLPQSVNLNRLDIDHLRHFDQHVIVVESEMMPKIYEFRTSDSYLSTTKLLHAIMQDGRPAFNFMDLRCLYIFLMESEDEQNFRYLLQNAQWLENIHLSVSHGQSLVGLHDILSPIARTLKVLSFSVSTYYSAPLSLPALAGLCEELEAMTGHYMLEALSIEFDIEVGDATVDSVGCDFQKVEKVLVKPGWSALRQVSFIVSSSSTYIRRKWTKAFQSRPDIYLSLLSNLESVSFNFLVCDEHDSFLFR